MGCVLRHVVDREGALMVIPFGRCYGDGAAACDIFIAPWFDEVFVAEWWGWTVSPPVMPSCGRWGL